MMLVRIIGTILTLSVWGLLSKIVTTAAPLMSAEISVKQLQDSDAAYISSNVGMSLLSNIHLPVVLLFLVLLMIWWKPLRGVISSMAAIVLVVLFTSTQAFAYCEIKDNDEYVEIGSNQTAFVIPMMGANKESQAKFMSLDYFTENKIAAKRYKVPHMVLRQAGWSYDYYIPAVKVIIVDRTPVYRNFTDSADTGTTQRKEGFHFESADSINITTGVTANGFVTEEDAAKFLYWFGSREQPWKKTGDIQTDCRAEFQTVVYGRSLADVMDTNVHGAIQAEISHQFGAHPTDYDIANKAPLMDAVVKKVTADFAAMGVTMKDMGYSEGLTFDQPVQDAINLAYIAHKEADRAITLAPALPNLRQAAEIELLHQLGEGLGGPHGRLQLPGVWVGDIGSMLGKLANLGNLPVSEAQAHEPTPAAHK